MYDFKTININALTSTRARPSSVKSVFSISLVFYDYLKDNIRNDILRRCLHKKNSLGSSGAPRTIASVSWTHPGYNQLHPVLRRCWGTVFINLQKFHVLHNTAMFYQRGTSVVVSAKMEENERIIHICTRVGEENSCHSYSVFIINAKL